MAGYYDRKLSGRRLQRCYEVAPSRVVQYLEAEILFAMRRLGPADQVLELGCGCGRIAFRLADATGRVTGIDHAEESLRTAMSSPDRTSGCRFLCMDASRLGFAAGSFDAVLCLQNGICAFGGDTQILLQEALRVTRPGGVVLFSTYSDRFWLHRLEWFRTQAGEGLVGQIDEEASGEGVIVCRDGFRSGRLRPADWMELCGRLGVAPLITEVDGSSLFCEILKTDAPEHGEGSGTGEGVENE
jgi:SAM-dependent methyltransferase